MRLNTEQFLSLLEELKTRVQTQDSFEGTITYSCLDEHLELGEWEVTGTYRIGNIHGQGGMRVLHNSTELKATLLDRYRLTRQALLDALAYGSIMDETARKLAVQEHLQTLEMVKAMCPEAEHVHSTAEWYLTH